MFEAYTRLKRVATSIGLRINATKTKYLLAGCLTRDRTRVFGLIGHSRGGGGVLLSCAIRADGANVLGVIVRCILRTIFTGVFLFGVWMRGIYHDLAVLCSEPKK